MKGFGPGGCSTRYILVLSILRKTHVAESCKEGMYGLVIALCVLSTGHSLHRTRTKNTLETLRPGVKISARPPTIHLLFLPILSISFFKMKMMSIL